MPNLVDTPLIDVWFLDAGHWFDERHTNNPDTLYLTIGMTLDRFDACYALWNGGAPETSQWTLLRWKRDNLGTVKLVRYYPTKEAAEMIAIHNA